jgi:cytochrome c-type biogenesis protein CcmH
MKYLLPLFLFFSLIAPAQAAIEAYQFKDAKTEADYRHLVQVLRCLVCQNQNLADSNADLAKDLRHQTYEMLQQGKSKQDVINYMVARYGDFVLYQPPLKKSTFLLWLGPFVLLVLVLLIVMIKIKKTRSVEAPEPKNLDQAKNLLSKSGDKK